MKSPKGIAIAAGVGIALLAIVLYVRSGHAPRDAQEPSVATTEPAARDRVEQRLQQLHEAHDRSGREGLAAAGKIEARSGAANPQRMAPPRTGAGQMPMPNALGSAGNNENVRDNTDLDVDPDDLPGLKKIAVSDTDPERRLAAVTLLGASEDPEALPALAQALSDEDDEVRMAAIQSLSDFTGDAPLDLLAKVVVDDPSADNRYEALQALSDIGGERATAAIQKALQDPDEDVRSLAEGILDMEDTYQDPLQDAGDQPTPPQTPPQP
jgi:hypothetical protein